MRTVMNVTDQEHSQILNLIVKAEGAARPETSLTEGLRRIFGPEIYSRMHGLDIEMVIHAVPFIPFIHKGRKVTRFSMGNNLSPRNH